MTHGKQQHRSTFLYQTTPAPKVSPQLLIDLQTTWPQWELSSVWRKHLHTLHPNINWTPPHTHSLSLPPSASSLKKKEGGGRWRLQKETPYMWGGELLTDTGVVKNLSWLHGKTQGQRLPFPVCLNAWLCWERCLLLSEEDVWQLLRPGHDLGKILSSHHSSCAQDCLYLSTHKLQPIAFKCFIQLLLHIHPSQDKKTILTIRQNPYHKESSSNEMFWWWVYYKHHSCH